MKISEIRELTDSELVERLEADKRAYVENRIAHAVSPLTQPSSLRDQRRTIARLKTELTAREKSANKNN
ncbi:ribosomal protein L29 [Bacteroidales bacterium KA00251]|nr:ribosomal protein L29 [Bacteroidales bacterium KA00251]